MPAQPGRRHHVVTVALLALLTAEIALVLLGGHRGTHMARDLLVPGAGLLETYRWAALAFVGAAVVATVAWLRWGADWTMPMVVAGAMATTFVTVSPSDHPAAVMAPVRAAHEFPLVVLVAAALSWARSVFVRMPGVRRVAAARAERRHGLDDPRSVGPVDRCRAAAVLSLVGEVDPAWQDAVADDDVATRARRVGLVARGRLGGDPFRRDHAHARAARLAAGLAGPDAAAELAADADRSPLGLPCSEPGWVRPLDATLAAAVLAREGHPDALDALRAAYGDPWCLRGSSRPAWCWTPAMLSAGRAAPWEHATATAIARWCGAITADDDWRALRRAALGAAARGTAHPHDERLVAAARLWLRFVDDAEAARLLARPTVRHDPLAVAVDRLAMQR